MRTRSALSAVSSAVLIAAGLVLPAALMSSPALAAGENCTYASPATTTTSVTIDNAVVTAGQPLTGTASVATGGTLPGGTLRVTAYAWNRTAGAYNPNGFQAVVSPSRTVVTGSQGRTWSIDTTSRANRTFKIVATYTTNNCQYSNSQSGDVFGSVYAIPTRTVVSNGPSGMTATVYAPDGTAIDPEGTVTFRVSNRSNCSASVAVATTPVTVGGGTGESTASTGQTSAPYYRAFFDGTDTQFGDSRSACMANQP